MRYFWLAPSALATLVILAAGDARADYPLAEIKNNTEYTVQGKVEYLSAWCSDDSYSVPPGGTWKARSRGICLIDAITGSISGSAKHGESTRVTPYDSTGTSYSQFQINAFGGQYRIFSKQEHARVSDTKHDKSPGFYFVNKTEWPVLYSLDQAGCLYHDVIPRNWQGTDGRRKVDTGAVWFTLRVSIQPDGVNPQSDWDCVRPVAEIVGEVLLAALSGGASGAAMSGAKYVTKTVVKKVIKEAAKEAFKAAATEVTKSMATRIGEYLDDAGTITMGGQYAGYEWPFRCDKMPEYHITGGPKMFKDEEGSVYLEEGAPFKITKVNSCGNDMMLGSPKSGTAESDADFPDFRGAPETSPSGPGQSPSNQPPANARHCAAEGERCQFNGSADVYYGAQNTWVTKRLSNGTACTNGVFGDPLVGVRKACRIVQVNSTRPPPQPGALELNIDRPGGDLVDFDLPVPDPQVCRERCVNEPRCAAFTFAPPNTWGGRTPHCWLKHSVPAKRPKRDHISGVVRQVGPPPIQLGSCTRGARIAVDDDGSAPAGLALICLGVVSALRRTRRRG